MVAMVTYQLLLFYLLFHVNKHFIDFYILFIIILKISRTLIYFEPVVWNLEE